MELISRLHKLEEEFDLSELITNDRWIYPIIKQHIIFPSILIKNQAYNKQEESKGTLFWLKALPEYLKWSYRNSYKGKPDILLFDSAISRRKRKDGNYFSLYSDFLFDVFGCDSVLMFEYPLTSSPFHRLPILTKNIFYPDLNILKVLLKAKLKKIHLERGHTILKEIFNQLGINYSISSVDGFLSKYFWSRKFYYDFLKKNNPQLVFLISSYHYQKMALADACKMLNIPSIELQHGHISQNHAGYIYKQVPSRCLFPDYFFSFGDYFTDLINVNSRMFSPDRVKSVGFYHLEETKTSPVHLDSDFLRLSEEFKLILISSDWTINYILKEFVIKVTDLLPPEYKIIYKTHPAEKDTSNFYSVFRDNKKIYFIDNPTVNILELMKISQIHSTVFSTSLFEASFFGLPNIFIRIEGFTNHIIDFIDNQSNFLVETPEEFVSKTKEIIMNHDSVRNKAVAFSQQFYKENVTENIINTVRNIKDISKKSVI